MDYGHLNNIPSPGDKPKEEVFFTPGEGLSDGNPNLEESLDDNLNIERKAQFDPSRIGNEALNNANDSNPANNPEILSGTDDDRPDVADSQASTAEVALGIPELAPKTEKTLNREGYEAVEKGINGLKSGEIGPDEFYKIWEDLRNKNIEQSYGRKLAQQ